MAFDRRHDSAVTSRRFLPPSLDLPRARIPQLFHKNVGHFQHYAVIGSKRHAVVEFGILVEGGIALILLLFLPLPSQ